MKLIVGLGNPGIIYANTRHNIGFSVVKALAKKHKVSFKSERLTSALTAKLQLGAEKVVLAMPLTFMNLSGGSVRRLLNKFKIGPKDILVVCDDLDLEFGRLRLRPSGSSAGQRGVQSLINSLDSQEFARLRVGIGRPHESLRASDFVLSSFNRKEKSEIKEIVDDACDCLELWVSEGLDKAMNIFNSKNNKK